jgi:hypothetical protein
VKEFEATFNGLSKGLRPFGNLPRNEEFLMECYNVAPDEKGLVIHEILTSLNADGVSWGGEGQKAAASTTRSITINVKDYVDLTDLEDVSVYLDGSLEGTTDSDGNITIADVAIGGHALKLTKSVYTDSDADDLYNDFIMVI